MWALLAIASFTASFVLWLHGARQLHFVGVMSGGRGRTQGRPIWGAAAVRRVGARLHRLGSPPEREFVADSAAAELLGDALGLATVLARLKESVTWGAPVSILDAGTPFTAPIVDGISGTSLDERIHHLERMAAEEQARRAKAILRHPLRRGSRFYPRAGAPQRRMRVHPWPGRRVAHGWRLDGQAPQGPEGSQGCAQSPACSSGASTQPPLRTTPPSGDPLGDLGGLKLASLLPPRVLPTLQP